MDPVMYDELSPLKRRLVREQYRHEQGGLCWYCKASLNELPPAEILVKPVNENLFPDGFFNWPVHLHHDKETGLTIGAVHCYCNAVSFQYEELPARKAKDLESQM